MAGIFQPGSVSGVISSEDLNGTMPMLLPAIVFYKSSFCPRCKLVRRELNKLRQEYPVLAVEEVDVLANPLRAWRDGIRMIPALRAGDEHLAGVILGKEQIRRLVARYLDRTAPGHQQAP